MCIRDRDETWATFKTILGDAETLLENDNATQEAVDEKAEELLNAITALRMIPVSYTHLDVYKRQKQLCKLHRGHLRRISVF